MAKQFLFESLHDEKAYRLINQAGVKMAIPPDEGNENYNCCWDGVLSPDGKFYYTLSSEAGKYDHAKLVRYNYENNSIDECMYVGSVANTKTRLMPHSKLHTSINFRPADNKCGYHVIATTHNTDKAPQHPEWMPFAHHNDMWEGFAGSIIVDYDPDTGATENWGVPVPRETIYGAEYDPAHDRLYMIGFMRGHVYSFDCKTRTVTKDLGKAAEVFNFRLSLAPDGNLYGCTKSGAYYRINTETNCLEDLHYQVPYYPGALNNNTWYRYMACAQPTPDGKGMYFANYCAWDLIRFDFDTQEFSIVGSKVPKNGYFPEDFPCIDYHTDAFIVDKYNVIWYQQCISCRDYGGSRERLGARTTRLFRWDVENGREPEYLGIVGIPGRYHSLTCEMDYDPETDRVYCVDSGNGFGSKGPAAMCIDLSVYREHMYELGPVCDVQSAFPREATDEDVAKEEAKRKSGVGEEVTADNPFQAFPIADAYPIRLWNNVLRPEESEVIGMAWDEQGILHVLTGESKEPGVPCPFDEAKYVFRIRGREIRGRMEFDSIGDEYRQWLRDSIYPRPVSFDPACLAEGERLPEAVGRRYRAYATADIKWHDGRTFVGTRDAMCAMVSEDGTVYAVGNASAYGPVRCLCTNKAKDKLWGVSGDYEDLGYIFTYDDKHGLRQLGILNYNTFGYYRPTASNVLSSITLSPDEKTLAVGGMDRLGTVHVISL